MRYRKVLFVIPDVSASYSSKLNPHLGIAYLTAVLLKHHVDVEIVDLGIGHIKEDLIKKIKGFNPDLVAITLFSFGFVESYKLIDYIKDNIKQPVLLGGVHVSAVKSAVLKETKADFAIYGEGEYTMLELCQGKPLEKIQGLIYRTDKIIENEPRPYSRYLDEIPFPAYEHFELDKYVYPKEGRLPIATSRGCPYACCYCAVKKSMGQCFRPRSAENVIEEIEYWHKKGYKFFEFVDDCFTMDMERAKKICDLIIEKNLKIRWNCANGIRADRVDEELLNKMKKAGCIFVAYGLETGNEKILKRIKKAITFEKALSAFDLTKKVGIKFAVNFIIGNPEETYETAMDSIKLAKKIPADYINFSNMVPYPGTEIYEYVKEHGKFFQPKERFLTEATTKLGNPIFETKEFTYGERLKALKKGRAIAKRTHLQYRLGKTTGFIAYQFMRNNTVYNLFRRLATSKGLVKKMYDRIKCQ